MEFSSDNTPFVLEKKLILLICYIWKYYDFYSDFSVKVFWLLFQQQNSNFTCFVTTFTTRKTKAGTTTKQSIGYGTRIFWSKICWAYGDGVFIILWLTYSISKNQEITDQKYPASFRSMSLNSVKIFIIRFGLSIHNYVKIVIYFNLYYVLNFGKGI